MFLFQFFQHIDETCQILIMLKINVKKNIIAFFKIEIAGNFLSKPVKKKEPANQSNE